MTLSNQSPIQCIIGILQFTPRTNHDLCYQSIIIFIMRRTWNVKPPRQKAIDFSLQWQKLYIPCIKGITKEWKMYTWRFKIAWVNKHTSKFNISAKISIRHLTNFAVKKSIFVLFESFISLIWVLVNQCI